MWSQYDEDLSKNDFFKEIKNNHSDILKKAAEENWIICIPRRGSLKNDDISIKTILDHVLIPDVESKYITLSKKDVRLENRRLKLEQNNIFFSDIEVLFEETHYIEQISKYLVWCVNWPLFLQQNQINYTNNNVNLISVQDCIDFLYSETFGYNLLKHVQKLCLDFWKSCGDCFEGETLQSQKDFLGNLYSQCLQVCFKNDVISDKCHQNPDFLDSLKLSIETYMQYCLGKRLIYCINTLHHSTDCMINKMVRNSIDMSLSSLNISSDFSDLILNAQYELSRINNFVTVLDKINCLSRTFNIFNNKSLQNDKNLYVTSDDFLQILVYLILKCDVSNWTANLTFLKEFQFATSVNSDQTNFLVSSLEAAIAFIKSSQFLAIKKTLIGGTCSASPFFDKMYVKFRDKRNLAELDELVTNANERNSTKLCHPLCLCIKCKNIISQNVNNVESYKILNNFHQNFVIKATIENDSDFLEFLLSLDFDIDFRDNFGKTALHYAAEMGLQDIVLLLINAEVNVNSLDNEKNTALHLTCDRGHDNCVKALIYSSHFVEINLQNIFGETPLFLATRWGYFDIIKILLENGASLCVKNNRNMMVYNLSPNYYITKLFRKFGSERSNSILGEVEKDKNSSFNNASNISEDYSTKMLSSLKEQSVIFGVQPKTTSDLKKLELLLKAVIYNDIPLACFYLGYNSNSADENLTKKCHPLCTCALCSSKANDFEDNSFEQNKFDAKTDYKFNINMCNTEGFTPLHIAAKYGRTEILRVLLDGGALLNICTDKTFHTPLHLAVIYQRVQAVKELLKCGNCDVNAQDFKGNTPLYYACARNSNSIKIVELLLQNGADSQKKNLEDKTVLQMCEEKNFFRTCRILRESMGYFVPRTKDSTSEYSRSNISFENIDTDFEIL